MLNLTLAVSRKYYIHSWHLQIEHFFYKKDFKFSKFYQKIWYIFFQLKINILKIEKNWYCDLTIKRDIKLFVNIFHLSSLHLLNDQVLISWDRASLNSELAMLLTTDSKMLWNIPKKCNFLVEQRLVIALFYRF